MTQNENETFDLDIQEYQGRTTTTRNVEIPQKLIEIIKKNIKNRHNKPISIPLEQINKILKTQWQTSNNAAYQLKKRVKICSRFGLYVGTDGEQRLYFRLATETEKQKF